jgi:hypothetical protein
MRIGFADMKEALLRHASCAQCEMLNGVYNFPCLQAREAEILLERS